MIDLTSTLNPSAIDPDELEQHRLRMCELIDGKFACGYGGRANPCGRILGPNDAFCCPEHEPLRLALFRAKEAKLRAESIERYCSKLTAAPILNELPKLELARVDNERFRTKAPQQFQQFANKWNPKSGGNVLLLGHPGSWKTSAAVALIHRMAAGARTELEKLDSVTIRDLASSRTPYSVYDNSLGKSLSKQPGPVQTCAEAVLCGHWTTALDLVMAGRRHPLGQGEAPAIELAKTAPVLTIDELGPQATTDRDATLMDVLDARYRAGLVTIGTSGMTAAEFQATHGGAVWRRLAEEGIGRVLEVKRG